MSTKNKKPKVIKGWTLTNPSFIIRKGLKVSSLQEDCFN